MEASQFQNKLRRLNPRLRIFCGNDDSKPAGIYTLEKDGYELICGISKNFIPEFSIRDDKGHIVVGGWNRVIKILVAEKLIDRHTSYKYFGHWDEHRVPEWQQERSDIDKEMEAVQAKGYWKPEEIVDIGREIARRKPTAVDSGD